MGRSAPRYHSGSPNSLRNWKQLCLTNLYKTRNAVLQAIQSPPILTNPKSSSSSSQNACRHCKRLGHWKQNCPALKKRKKLNSNDPRYLIIGKYTPKLLGENLDTFSVPLRCTFSTLIFSRTWEPSLWNPNFKEMILLRGGKERNYLEIGQKKKKMCLLWKYW